MNRRFTMVLVGVVMLAACAADDGSTAATTVASLATTTTTVAATTSSTTAPEAEPVDDEHDHEHEHEDDAEHDHGEDEFEAPVGAVEVADPESRLVVSDAADTVIRVFDLVTEEELGAFEVSETARVYEVGRYVLAAQREEGRVDVIDAGAWSVPHGDHFHHYMTDPSMEDDGIFGSEPTHVVEHDGLVAIFNDGDGSVIVLDVEHIGEDDAIVAEIDSGAPHHGVAVPLADHGVLAVTTPVDGEVLPDGVAIVDLFTGEEEAWFDGCPQLHGEAATESSVVFGCADGVLVVSEGDAGWESVRVDRPDGVSGEDRTGTLKGGEHLSYVIGNLGSSALVRVDIDEAAATLIPVPESVASFAFDADQEVVLVLAVDGAVYRIDALTGDILDSVDVIEAFQLPTGHGGPPTPAILSAGGRAYVTVPADGVVVELGVEGELRLARKLGVGGTPASIAVVGIPESEGR